MAKSPIDPSETLVRVLKRTPADFKTIPSMDGVDFVRDIPRNNESGISLLRRKFFSGDQAMYDYVNSKKLLGIAECAAFRLQVRQLILEVTADDRHVSLRCTDCDMAPKGCKPNDDQATCPMVDEDGLKLADEFRETAPISFDNKISKLR